MVPRRQGCSLNFIVAEIQGVKFSAKVVATDAQTTGMSETAITTRPGTLWLALATGDFPTSTQGHPPSSGRPPPDTRARLVCVLRVASASKVGNDVTETLEMVPRPWKVIQTVPEKFTCRDFEKLPQPPAPYHALPRGWVGPNLLSTIVFEKYGQHQSLNRQSKRYAREGRAQRLYAGRPGGRVRRGTAPVARVDRCACAGRAASAR